LAGADKVGAGTSPLNGASSSGKTGIGQAVLPDPWFSTGVSALAAIGQPGCPIPAASADRWLLWWAQVGGRALRLVQANINARDDSALGRLWAEALGVVAAQAPTDAHRAGAGRRRTDVRPMSSRIGTRLPAG